MKIFKAVGNAAAGIAACYKKERNFKIEVFFSIAAIGLGATFHISWIEWAIILLCIAMVLALELLNTAIEKLCNFIHPGIHPVIKLVKDMAAGAVLVAAFTGFVAGSIIFVPKIFTLLKAI